MKGFITLLATLILAPAAFANYCKTGDLKACAAALSKIHEKDKGAEFSKSFDEVCEANKKFKCIKKIVRGEIADEMKYTKQDHPKGHFFPVDLQDESYIYILEGK